MRTFEYEGHTVTIVPDMRKGKPVYWFCVDQRPIDFVSNVSLASSLAVRFIDVITDEHYSVTRNAANYRSSAGRMQ